MSGISGKPGAFDKIAEEQSSSNPFAGTGLYVDGLVSRVESYTNKETGEVRHSVWLAVRGSMVKVSLNDPPRHDQYVEGSRHKMSVKFVQTKNYSFLAEVV